MGGSRRSIAIWRDAVLWLRHEVRHAKLSRDCEGAGVSGYEVLHYIRLLRIAPAGLSQRCARRWTKPPYFLDQVRRPTVLDASREVCLHHGWSFWAAHVRTNQVHVIVEADVRPEKVLHAFKSDASRALNRLGIDGPARKRWARHGSTRWLRTDEDARESVRYVVSGQGEPMEVYLADPL